MSEETKRVAKVSDETRYAIKRKSAYTLPVNPSERGMGADEIKKAFYAPVTETANSVLAELDRVAEQTNAALDEAQTDRNVKLDEAKQYTDDRETEIRGYIDGQNTQQDGVTEQMQQAMTVARGDLAGHDARLQALEGELTDTVTPGLASLEERKADKVSPTTSGDLLHTGNARITGETVLADTTVEGSLLNLRLSTAYEDIEKNKLDITALRAELSGKGRIFSLPDFSALLNFLQYGGHGTAQIYLLEDGASTYYYAEELKTGDVIYITEVGVPDVWWIATDTAEGAYDCTYDGIAYTLVGYGADGSIVGQAQPLETDYMVIEGYATSASVSAGNAASSATEAASSSATAAAYAAEAQAQAEEAGNHAAQAQTQATLAAEQTDVAREQVTAAAEQVTLAEEEANRACEEADRAQAEADRAQDVIDTSNAALRAELEPRISRNSKRITNLERGLIPDPFETDSTTAYAKDVPANALPYAEVTKVGGMTYKSHNLLPFSYYESTITRNGGTWTVGVDGKISASGTPTGVSYIMLASRYSLPKSDAIIATSKARSNANVSMRMQIYDSTGNEVAAWTNYSMINVDLTQYPTAVTYSLGLYRDNNDIEITGVFYPMINEGDTALPYEPYFEGIRSASVKEIESTGKNLMMVQDVFDGAPNYKIETVDGRECVGYDSGKDYKKSVSLDASMQYTVTFDAKSVILADGTVCPVFIAFFYSDGTRSGVFAKARETDWTSYSITSNTGKTIVAVGVNATTNTVRSYIDINTFQIEKNTEATDYSPYCKIQYSIPSEIQALDGYGLGISDTHHNYIDWRPEEGIKRFVQTCAAREYAEGDEALENVVTDGATKTVYVLDEPIITDLSGLLTDDNFIEVEGGGTVMMVNEYGLAAPGEITYMLKEETE